jgi:peptidoglycan L-alanyl-D-glutamate endopeptidase CwlK
MSGFSFGARSLKNLEGVHPALVGVMQEAIKRTPIDFSIIEGLRTPERQRQLVAAGASRTLNSRHLTGHAVDIAPYVNGEIRWDWPLYNQIAPVIMKVADEKKVAMVWGGSWKMRDGPHFELSRKVYK